jgi:hypothetical protein
MARRVDTRGEPAMTTGRSGLGRGVDDFAGTPEEREILAAIVAVHAEIKRLSSVRPDDLDVDALGAAEQELARLRGQLAELGSGTKTPAPDGAGATRGGTAHG